MSAGCSQLTIATCQQTGRWLSTESCSMELQSRQTGCRAHLASMAAHHSSYRRLQAPTAGLRTAAQEDHDKPDTHTHTLNHT